MQQNNIEEGTNRGLWSDFGMAKFYYIVKKVSEKLGKTCFFSLKCVFPAKISQFCKLKKKSVKKYKDCVCIGIGKNKMRN